MSTRLTYTSGDLGAETDAAFEAALEAARGHDAGPHAHLIAGERVADGELFERRDPARTERVASRAHEAGPELVGRAVEAARAAAPGWAGTEYRERCRLLRAVADGIGERHMELAALASLETGKSRTESILEVQEAIDLIEAYAGHMEENEGYTQPLNSFVEGERNVDVLRPYGVFGVIAPFNFPVALSVGMFSSALIAGNTVVFKPSEESPSTGAVLAEIVQAAALPAGAFNLVQGGPDTGRALVDAPRRRHRVHGLSRGRARDRPQDAGGPVRAPCPDGDGRQEPGDRDRERRRGRRGRGCGALGVRPLRPEVQRLLAGDRGRLGARRVRGAARRPGGGASARRPERPRRVRGTGDQRGQRGALRACRCGGRARRARCSRRRAARAAGALRGADRGGRPPARARARARRAVPAVRDGHARRARSRRRSPRRTRRSTASRPGSSPATSPRRSASSPRSRRASST